MRIKWDPTMSAGSVLQAAIVSAGLIGAYVKIQGTVDRHDLQIAATARTVETLSLTQADIAQNLRVLTAIVNERTHPQQ